MFPQKSAGTDAKSDVNITTRNDGLIGIWASRFGVKPVYDEPINPGDTYIAVTDSGKSAFMLLCVSVDSGTLVPATPHQHFNASECCKVVAADNDSC